MAPGAQRSGGAYRTIGEVSQQLDIPQHILRYWETRFPQLRPLQRAGNRRYYSTQDVALVERINRLLNQQGYTIKGAFKLLKEEGSAPPSEAASLPLAAAAEPNIVAPPLSGEAMVPVAALLAIRTRLARALDLDDMAARI
jgi:DNA-binding transcriptional MerR regulator